jgi:benzoylformate decarboxylase
MNATASTIRVLLDRGIGTVYGNPGSSELPFLNVLPAELQYVLCLQESIAVAAAVGHSMATGEATFVNLHGQPGVGHAIGAIAAAARAGAPVVIVAGLPDSRHLAEDPHLGGPVVDVVAPLVKSATQVHRSQDVAPAIEQAFRTALAAPRGPAFVAVPMDLWDGDAGSVTVPASDHLSVLEPAVPVWLGDLIGSASSPALVVGGGHDSRSIDGLTVEVAEHLGLRVYGSPLASAVAFPTDHPAFGGHLGLSKADIRGVLAQHDVIVLISDRPPTVYAYSDGPMFPPGADVVLVTPTAVVPVAVAATHCLVADPVVVLQGLLRLPARERGREPDDAAAVGTGSSSDPSSPSSSDPWSEVFARLAETLPPDAIVVDEAMTLAPRLRTMVPSSGARASIRTPGGGLGFGVAAAIGAQLARPDATVVAVVGDGAFMYAPQALWTAARYSLPIKVVVVDNGGYESLRSFARATGMELSGTVDLELDGIDRSALARSLGVAAADVVDPEQVAAALRTLLDAPGPGLLRIAVG